MVTDRDIVFPNLNPPPFEVILEVANIVKNLTQTKSSIIFQSLPKDDPKVRRPNIDRANSILNWNPKIQLEEGLLKTIKAYKEKLNEK